MATAMAKSVTDPVCGMEINPANAAGQSEYAEQTYYFCSGACKSKFDATPAKYAGANTVDNSSGTPQSGVIEGAPLNGNRQTRTTPDGLGERVDLSVTGMTCAACARRIERKLSRAPGVRRAGVNFATSRATVEYDP